MTVRSTPLPGPFGLEIESLDPKHLTDADAEMLNRMLGEHGILVAHGLDLSHDDHVALTRAFGNPAIHPIESIRLAEAPEIIELKVDLSGQFEADDPRGDDIVGDISWHSDLTYTAEPSRGSVLYAVDVPNEGGDTAFIDTAMVFDALPASLRDRVLGVEVVHSFTGEIAQPASAAAASGTAALRTLTDFEPVVHPLVHRHPVSGRPVLNISPVFACAVVGESDDASRALLDELHAFATRQQFVHVHQWRVGDVVIWDNWRTMHTALGHKKRHRRHMLRTTVQGGPLPAFSPEAIAEH